MDEINIDEFYARMFKTLSDKFDENQNYPGKYIKLEIDMLLKRIVTNE